MFSTTAIVKNSKFSGKIIGTHQRLDQAARRSLGIILRGYSDAHFPSIQEIIHFEGTRGPDGLKRKSPGLDEPSHMLVENHEAGAPATGDARSVPEMIIDHRYNLVQALRHQDITRAAFEAAWMAHMITDGLTPAHHFPLSEVKDELMTDKELMHVFGQPIKGVMHGRNVLETLRNNWLYWGAGGCMSKHIAYEYGVLMIAASLTPQSLMIKLSLADLSDLDVSHIFDQSLARIRALDQYQKFLDNGWTAELATEVKEVLLPEIVRAITLGWLGAASEAYDLPRLQQGKSHHE